MFLNENGDFLWLNGFRCLDQYYHSDCFIIILFLLLLILCSHIHYLHQFSEIRMFLLIRWVRPRFATILKKAVVHLRYIIVHISHQQHMMVLYLLNMGLNNWSRDDNGSGINGDPPQPAPIRDRFGSSILCVRLACLGTSRIKYLQI